MSRKRKLAFTWNDFQKHYKTYDSTSGWSKRCTADYNQIRNDPTGPTKFYDELKNRLINKRKISNAKGFSSLFGIDRLERKEPKVPIPQKRKGSQIQRRIPPVKLNANVGNSSPPNQTLIALSRQRQTYPVEYSKKQHKLKVKTSYSNVL